MKRATTAQILEIAGHSRRQGLQRIIPPEILETIWPGRLHAIRYCGTISHKPTVFRTEVFLHVRDFRQPRALTMDMLSADWMRIQDPALASTA